MYSRCRYDSHTGAYYNTISWKPPNHPQLPVTSYMVKVVYGKKRWLCFNFNATRRAFDFDASAGFVRGKFSQICFILALFFEICL